MRHRTDSPNGIMEFLIARMAERLRDEGLEHPECAVEFMSLSAAPLAGMNPQRDNADETGHMDTGTVMHAACAADRGGLVGTRIRIPLAVQFQTQVPADRGAGVHLLSRSGRAGPNRAGGRPRLRAVPDGEGGYGHAAHTAAVAGHPALYGLRTIAVTVVARVHGGCHAIKNNNRRISPSQPSSPAALRRILACLP